MMTRPVPHAPCCLLLLVAIGCSRGGISKPDDGGLIAGGPDAAAPDGAIGSDGAPRDFAAVRDLAPPQDLASGTDLSAPPDLGGGILQVHIFVDDLNQVHISPPSYGVPAMGTFKVNWINDAASTSPVDIEKDDMFNHVPIVLGLSPGDSYYDSVRPWCGIFTGTFFFRVTAGAVSADMPINCDM